MGTMQFIKVDEDPDRLIVRDGVILPSGGTFKIQNSRGFVVAEITENGDLKIKGRTVKI